MATTDPMMMMFYALLGSSVLMVFYPAMTLLLLGAINVPAFSKVVVKLLNSGDISRAIKLCNAANPKRVAAVAATKAMLELATQTTNPTMLVEAFDAEKEKGLRGQRLMGILAVGGLMDLVTAFVVYVVVGGYGLPPTWSLGVAGFAGIFGVSVVRVWLSAPAQLDTLRDDLLNALGGGSFSAAKASLEQNGSTDGGWNWGD